MYFSNLEKDLRLNLRQTFLFSTLAWVAVAIFGSLPFILSSQTFTFSDAFSKACQVLQLQERL